MLLFCTFPRNKSFTLIDIKDFYIEVTHHSGFVILHGTKIAMLDQCNAGAELGYGARLLLGCDNNWKIMMTAN